MRPWQADDPDQNREYRHYLTRHMGPMTHALMLVTVFAYLAATGVSAIAAVSSIPLLLRLAPTLPMLLVALVTRHVRRPLPLSMLALLCVLLLEIGINLNGIDRLQGLPWVLPGCLLVSVTSSVIWPGRWDFIAAMALCVLGPLPMLLFGDIDGSRMLQYIVYMVIAICLSTVLRAFMTRTLFEQFRLERQLREQVNTDGLTGLLLRNRFLELARLTLDDAQRQQEPSCMLYLDADHFKQLNDDYGHAAGDVALIALANAMRAQLRETDLIGRIGGEEFALLLSDVDLQEGSIGPSSCGWPYVRYDAQTARLPSASASPNAGARMKISKPCWRALTRPCVTPRAAVAIGLSVPDHAGAGSGVSAKRRNR